MSAEQARRERIAELRGHPRSRVHGIELADALERIEALEKALRDMRDWKDQPGFRNGLWDCDDTLEYIGQTARAVLEAP